MCRAWRPSRTISRSPVNRKRQLASLLFVVAVLASGVLIAQYQKKPPDFGGVYAFPTPTHPEPRDSWVRALDVAMLDSRAGPRARGSS